MSKIESKSSSTTINLRATPEQKALIDRAAAALGKSRTEFMLDSAREAAEHTLLDRTLFLLDDEGYRAFIRQLDAPAKPSDALKRLMHQPAPWER